MTLNKVIQITVAAKTLILGAQALIAGAGKPSWGIFNYVLTLEGTGYYKWWASAADDTVGNATVALSGEINPGVNPVNISGSIECPVIKGPEGGSVWLELNGGTKLAGHISYGLLAGR